MISIVTILIHFVITYSQPIYLHNLPFFQFTCVLFQYCILPTPISYHVYHASIFTFGNQCQFIQSKISTQQIYSTLESTQNIISIGINQLYVWYLLNTNHGDLNLSIIYKQNQIQNIKLGHAKYPINQIGILMQPSLNQFLIFSGNQYWILTESRQIQYKDRNNSQSLELISFENIGQFFILALYPHKIQIYYMHKQLTLIDQYYAQNQTYVDFACQDFSDKKLIYIITQDNNLVVLLIKQGKIALYSRHLLQINKISKIEVINDILFVVSDIENLYSYVTRINYKIVQKQIYLQRYYIKNENINDIQVIDKDFSIIVAQYYHRLMKFGVYNLSDNNINKQFFIELQAFDLKISKRQSQQFWTVGYNQTHFFIMQNKLHLSKIVCRSDEPKLMVYRLQLLASDCMQYEQGINAKCKIIQSFAINYQKQQNKLKVNIIILIQSLFFVVIFAIIIFFFYLKMRQKIHKLTQFHQKSLRIQLIQIPQKKMLAQIKRGLPSFTQLAPNNNNNKMFAQSSQRNFEQIE